MNPIINHNIYVTFMLTTRLQTQFQQYQERGGNNDNKQLPELL